jgi:N-methylhydantoinase A
LRASFDGPTRIARSADMRYGEQVFEIPVALDDIDWTAADPLPEIARRFHATHEALFTYSLAEEDTVLVNARVAVTGILSTLPQEPALPASAPAAPRAMRPIRLDGDWTAAPVFDFDSLAPWQAISGPALIEGRRRQCCCAPATRASQPRSAGSTSPSVPPAADRQRNRVMLLLHRIS